MKSDATIAQMSRNKLAIVGFFLGSLFAVVGWVCSLKILLKMRSEDFGISDLWSPTGKLYRRYAQEAKRGNWSMLPLYIPAVLGILVFCYFLIAVALTLRAAFNWRNIAISLIDPGRTANLTGSRYFRLAVNSRKVSRLRLFSVCQRVEQPYWCRSSRHIHLFRRNRRGDRDELVCIFGIVE